MENTILNTFCFHFSIFFLIISLEIYCLPKTYVSLLQAFLKGMPKFVFL